MSDTAVDGHQDDAAAVEDAVINAELQIDTLSQESIVRALAMYEHSSEGDRFLALAVGDVVVVTAKTQPDGWWTGFVQTKPHKVGLFPSNYVSVLRSRLPEEMLVEKLISQMSLCDDKCRAEELTTPRTKARVIKRFEDASNKPGSVSLLPYKVNDVLVVTDMSISSHLVGYLESDATRQNGAIPREALRVLAKADAAKTWHLREKALAKAKEMANSAVERLGLEALPAMAVIKRSAASENSETAAETETESSSISGRQQGESEEQESAKRDLTVCVTGVTGYLGSMLVQRLIKQGYDVVAAVQD
eukprot:COSAG02_NODE_16499_length_1079_cov_0.729592_1_plen_304_part_10